MMLCSRGVDRHQGKAEQQNEQQRLLHVEELTTGQTLYGGGMGPSCPDKWLNTSSQDPGVEKKEETKGSGASYVDLLLKQVHLLMGRKSNEPRAMGLHNGEDRLIILMEEREYKTLAHSLIP